MEDRPPVTLIVPTTQPWPQARPVLDACFEEARELDGEVLFVDRDGAGLPPEEAERYPGLVRLGEADASIYRLRDLGFAAARGEVVCITEDHCVPYRGWLRRHLDMHAAHADVAAVGGPVRNGMNRRLIDWAIFLINHAPWTPPARSGPRTAIDRANISYKHRVMPEEPSVEGRDETMMDERLAAKGERFWFDADNVITHVQTFGLRGTVTILFHNARAVAGLHVERGMPLGERLIRIPGSALVVPITLRRVFGAVARRPRAYSPRALASLTLVPFLALSIASGFAVAYAIGPGGSAAHIH